MMMKKKEEAEVYSADERLVIATIDSVLSQYLPDRAVYVTSIVSKDPPTVRFTIQEWPLNHKINLSTALTHACLEIERRYGCHCKCREDAIDVRYTKRIGCFRKVAFLFGGFILSLFTGALIVGAVWATFFRDETL
jgi:hypothetical protein